MRGDGGILRVIERDRLRCWARGGGVVDVGGGQGGSGIRNSVVPGPPSLSAALDPPALKGRAPGAAAAFLLSLVIYAFDIVLIFC